MRTIIKQIEELKKSAIVLRENEMENTEAFVMVAKRIAYLYSYNADDQKAEFWNKKAGESDYALSLKDLKNKRNEV